jgi:pimeloyl-ACP methyl ester carboxylesterase
MAATQHGYATLNIDRLGSGNSDRPNALTLNFDVAGFVTHQLVTALRAGSVGPQFEKVILNGHSMGALAAQNEASRFHDVDGLIVTGIGHNSTAAGPPPSLLDFYPASLDPKFVTDLSTLGYLTTLPGHRAHAFIGAGTIEPGMNAVEETTMKDTFSPVELVALILDTSDSSKLTFGIRAPVLYAQGQYDAIWCGGTGDCNTDPQAAKESKYYSPGVSFTRVVIPKAGHSVNSSITAPQFYDASFSWLTAHHLD